jgi:cell division protease FtsH
MDGFADNSGIIVIAATNREDVLDPALLRAGRFDRQITVNLPDRKGREEIFKVHARGKTIDETVDFGQLARRTVGFSGADIANILNEAAILAVRANKDRITIREIDEAIDRRIAGPAKSSRALNPHERRAIAFHEAGHAIIGLKLKHSDKVQKITIIPRGRTGGHVMMTPEEDRFLLTKKELEARIIGYLGGRSSEEIFFDDISTGAHNDIEVATRIARLMVTEYGMSSLGPIQYEKDSGSVFLGRDYTSTQKNFSTQIAYEIDTEVRRIIDDAHNRAKEVITEHKDDVILIAETLLERETITAEEIEGLLKNRSLPKAEEIQTPVASLATESGSSK